MKKKQNWGAYRDAVARTSMMLQAADLAHETLQPRSKKVAANPFKIRTKSGETMTLTSKGGEVWITVSNPNMKLDDNDSIRVAGWLTKWYTDQEAAKKATRRPRKAKKND